MTWPTIINILITKHNIIDYLKTVLSGLPLCQPPTAYKEPFSSATPRAEISLAIGATPAHVLVL